MKTLIIGVIIGIGIYLIIDLVKSGQLKIWYTEFMTRIKPAPKPVDTTITDLQTTVSNLKTTLDNVVSTLTTLDKRVTTLENPPAVPLEGTVEYS